MGKKEENKATKHIVNNFQGATIHNFVYNDHGTTNIYESVSHSKEDDGQSQHFPLNRNEEEGRRWFEFLARRGFISNDTEIECWQYYMGFSAKRPDGLKPIVWLKTVETARMMIRKVHENLIEAGELKIV